MAEQRRINERLIALIGLGVVALNYPIVGLFSKKLLFCGVPLLYLYIFSLWFLFIIVLAFVIRKRRSPPSTPETGP